MLLSFWGLRRGAYPIVRYRANVWKRTCFFIVLLCDVSQNGVLWCNLQKETSTKGLLLGRGWTLQQGWRWRRFWRRVTRMLSMIRTSKHLSLIYCNTRKRLHNTSCAGFVVFMVDKRWGLFYLPYPLNVELQRRAFMLWDRHAELPLLYNMKTRRDKAGWL